MKTFTRKDYWTWFAYAILSYAIGLVMLATEIDALVYPSAPFMLAPVIVMIIAMIRRVRIIGYWWALFILVPFGALIIGCVADPE